MPPNESQPNKSAECGPVEPVGSEYRFPRVIMLDDESFAEFEIRVENPRPPTQALIDLFLRNKP